MALSHDPSWAKQADEATKRRAEKNRPWDHTCKACGHGYNSSTNYVMCPSCTAFAYDVLEGMEK